MQFAEFGGDAARPGTPEPSALLAGIEVTSGLPNRALLDWYLDNLLTKPDGCPLSGALLVIDLNQVHAMPYAFGEQISHQFLKMLGERIRSQVCAGQFVASLGHGEFAFVVSSCNGQAEILDLAQRLMGRINQTVMIKGREYYSSANIGIAFLDNNIEDSAALLHLAQAVLAEAKLQGGGAIKFAQKNSAQQASQKLQMMNAVRYACQRGEFHLVYQPIFNIGDGSIHSVETLLRWTSAQFGVVPPDVFIALLEQCGAIHEAGDWILRQACLQAVLWNQVSNKPFRVAVNLSAVQLDAVDFEQRLMRILIETRCDPRWLELEITEGVAVFAVKNLLERLKSIAKSGISLAIDDFGAGYSSFGYLASLPVEHIKLDRALIENVPHDPKSNVIVSAIQSLSASLGLTLTVEGIERQEQHDFCRNAGVPQAQGYLLARPGKVPDIDKLIGDVFPC